MMSSAASAAAWTYPARASARCRPRSACGVPLDVTLVERIRTLIAKHPTFGYGKLWALLHFGDGLIVNLKAVYRILKAKRWFVHQRTVTPQPRVQGRRSVAAASDMRWAIDLTHIYCGEDGWGHLAAIIDCHAREIAGWEFSLRGRPGEAERALKEACLDRFGTLRPAGRTPTIKSACYHALVNHVLRGLRWPLCVQSS
jgi:putative transposase